MNIIIQQLQKLIIPMSKIKKLLAPLSSPKKGPAERADEGQRRFSPFKTKASHPSSPKKSPNKLRKSREDLKRGSRSTTKSDVSGSSYLLVSSQETFICEPPPLPAGPSIQPVLDQPPSPRKQSPPRQLSPPRKQSSPRKHLTRSPIQTRSRTLAAASALPVAPSVPAPSLDAYDDAFAGFDQPLSSASSPEVLPGLPSAQATTTPNSSPNNQMVLYLDSFPGIQNLKQPWTIGDTVVPASALAAPQPSPSDQQQPLAGGSPPKKRRLLSRKANQRVERFADPSRPKLETIPEDVASLADSDQDGSRLSSCTHSSFTLSSPQNSFIDKGVAEPLNTPPKSASTQTSRFTVDPSDPRHSPSLKRARDTSALPIQTSNNDTHLPDQPASSKPDPNLILSSLFKMLEEDSV